MLWEGQVLKLKTIWVNDQRLDIYNIEDFPYELFRFRSTVERSKKSKKKYVDLVCGFDIETTTIHKSGGNDFAFMYIWQFAVEDYACIGRTWEEYKTFLSRLEKEVNCKWRKLVVYVHYLSFEFQFMRNFFKIDDIFCRSKRDVCYFVSGNIEYRCSFTLTNMSLRKFLEKSRGVTLYKLDGKTFDYSIIRYPDTELTDYELAYSVVDVLGLVQGIRSRLIEDTLATIPLTSTGYVRRVFRNAMISQPNHKKYMQSKRLTEHTYTLSREASRGAISGSNSIYTDEILEDVDSEDIKSSYPFQMATKYFPASRFIQCNVKYGSEKWYQLLNNCCCIIVWSCSNFKTKKWSAIPYVSKAKCRAIEGAKCGNGKVYMAKRIGMCCTEIDFSIIEQHYYFDNVVIHEFWCCDRGMLPKPFRETLLNMFQVKTDLEDGDPYDYAKYKNRINAGFGMMLTDILHSKILYEANSITPWKEEGIKDVEKALQDYYKATNSFLHYQDGVWVLAHGRDDLVRGMDCVGADLVQVDTDSVKHLGNYDNEFKQINDSIIANAETFDVKPYSIKNGKKHYLGVWEHEGVDGKPTYHKFKTLGAKKYCSEDENGKISITVAGLSKQAHEYFEKEGGIESFKLGTIITPENNSGRTSALYNDLPEPITKCINGHFVTMGSNIAVNDINYTLNCAGEWLHMILDKQIPIDEIAHFDGAFKNYEYSAVEL